MSSLPIISSLWVGIDPSYIEILCMKSFLDAGHRFKLYVMDDVGNIPDGVELCDAREVYAPEFDVGPRLRHYNAVYSDIFRLHLLAQRSEIWADCDAYCLRPFVFENGYCIGFEAHKGTNSIANGVLGLPSDSPALKAALELVHDPAPVPPYFSAADRERLEALRETGRTWGFHNLTWGASGPMLMDHFLRETGEIVHGLEPNVLYPGPRAFRRPLMRVPPKLDKIETPETLSVHIFGKTKRFLLQEFDGLPPEGSWLDMALRRHGIPAEDYPISPDELDQLPRESV